MVANQSTFQRDKKRIQKKPALEKKSVTVSIPVRNCVPYVEQAINSATNQDYENLSVIVIDGDSSDGTKELLNSLNRKKLSVIYETNAGSPCEAIKRCLTLPVSDIVIPLMADDYLADNTVVTRFVDAFSKNHADFVYGNVDYISRDNENRVRRRFKCKNFTMSDIRQGLHPCWPSVAFSGNLLQKLQFNEFKFNLACDFDFYLKIFSDESLNTAFLDYRTTFHRLGGASSKNLGAMLRANKEADEAWHLNNIQKPFLYFYRKFISKTGQYL